MKTALTALVIAALILIAAVWSLVAAIITGLCFLAAYLVLCEASADMASFCELRPAREEEDER